MTEVTSLPLARARKAAFPKSVPAFVMVNKLWAVSTLKYWSKLAIFCLRRTDKNCSVENIPKEKCLGPKLCQVDDYEFSNPDAKVTEPKIFPNRLQIN